MRYLVTGGAGFIGSHLVDKLLEDPNNEVVVVDDLSTGKLINLPLDCPNLDFHQESVMDSIDYLFKDIDVVFHLAGKTRPQESIVKVNLYNHVNIGGIVNVLDCCRDNKVKRLVFVSSSNLYGTQETYPTNEDAPAFPPNPYALTKFIGEQYCKLYERLYGLQSNYIRPFNVFGNRQPPDGAYASVVPKFINTLRKGKIPFITGDGKQARDFIFVDDVVDIIILASKCKEYGEAFNAGLGENISINDLYQTVCKLIKKDVKPTYIEEVIEPRVTLGDMTKVKSLLNWEPKFTLETGLRRML